MNSRPLVVPAPKTVGIWLAEALNQPQLPFVAQVGRKCFLFIKLSKEACQSAIFYFFYKSGVVNAAPMNLITSNLWSHKALDHLFQLGLRPAPNPLQPY